MLCSCCLTGIPPRPLHGTSCPGVSLSCVQIQGKAGPTSTFLVCIPPPPHPYWHAKYNIRDHVPIDVLSRLLNLGSRPICLKRLALLALCFSLVLKFVFNFYCLFIYILSELGHWLPLGGDIGFTFKEVSLSNAH